jgi:hypothetical protein
MSTYGPSGEPREKIISHSLPRWTTGWAMGNRGYECLVLRNDTRNSSIITVLERAYTSPLKLPKAKYNDLRSISRPKRHEI